MSKYGALSRTEGHSKWFLQKTLLEHDRSMEHPWMQMIYKQCFSVEQYAAWLALNRAVFAAMEEYLAPMVSSEPLSKVHDPLLARTPTLEVDLKQLLGAPWEVKAKSFEAESPALKCYLEHLAEDAKSPALLLAHHFLQYNAVLSGGAYLGDMVSAKLCVPHGAPGVRFYAFEGVEQGKGPARVQRYLRDFDSVQLSEEELQQMLLTMRRVYEDTEALMQEIFDMNPASGIAYGDSKAGGSAGAGPAPLEEQITLDLHELQGFRGDEGGRILLSLAGELLDVSAGRELYGPGGGYAVLAGHDVTRCLATMSLDESALDDLGWVPESQEDESALAQWREKLKAKYPVAGRLSHTSAAADGDASAGLRQRAVANRGSSPAREEEVPSSTGETQKCPISGKEGSGCPMSSFIGLKSSSSAPAKEPAAATSGFMAGKSMVASVQKSSASSEDSLLYRLCPLHWDEQTIKTLIIVALCSWTSGVFVGWNLHRQLAS